MMVCSQLLRHLSGIHLWRRHKHPTRVHLRCVVRGVAFDECSIYHESLELLCSFHENSRSRNFREYNLNALQKVMARLIISHGVPKLVTIIFRHCYCRSRKGCCQSYNKGGEGMLVVQELLLGIAWTATVFCVEESNTSKPTI